MPISHPGRLLATGLSSALLLASCNSKPTTTQDMATTAAPADSAATSSVANKVAATVPTTAAFGKTTDGTEVKLFDLTNAQSFLSCSNWLQEASSAVSPNTVKFLVGTKSDLLDKWA